jgi:hypothetical protein
MLARHISIHTYTQTADRVPKTTFFITRGCSKHVYFSNSKDLFFFMIKHVLIYTLMVYGSYIYYLCPVFENEFKVSL